MRKKIIILILTIILTVSCVACTPPAPPGGGGDVTENNNKYGALPTPLAALTDYGVSAKDYNPKELTYDASVYDTSSSDSAQSILVAKQKEEQAKHKQNGKYVWTDDDATFTRIFCYADCKTIIDRMALAAVDQARMIKFVNYIAREDVNSADDCNLVIGTGSAIEDYEELDALYEAYDNDSSDNDVYDKLQLKKRKVIEEIVEIFGSNADQFARVATHELAYSIEVVMDVMIPEYNTDHAASLAGLAGFKQYYKEEFFDYEGLVYLLAYIETVGIDIDSGSIVISKKPEITTLYGYYYQYEKVDYEVFPRTSAGEDAEYKDYLMLSHKTTMTEAEALRYNNLDRRHYQQAYRYTDDFYKKYYTAHFNFQAKQGIYDITEYAGGTKDQYAKGIGAAFDRQESLTYSGQMLAGLRVGMSATLSISDVNYVYTGNEENVKNYNKKNTAWNILSTADQGRVANKIKKVDLQRESLKSQIYTMDYKTISSSTLSESLKYQIYSYSGDYIRAIQSHKKSDVILNIELQRLKKNGASTADITAKEDEIGRNNAMYQNLAPNYQSAGVDGQLTKADGADWTGVKQNLKDAYKTDDAYIKYHEQHQSPSEADKKVDAYFEDELIKKNWSCGGTDVASTCKLTNGHLNCTEDYNTEHSLSRLMFNHDQVFRHVYGQVEVQYRDANLKSKNVTIAKISTAFVPGGNYTGAMLADGASGNMYTGSGSLIQNPKNIFMPDAFKKKTYETDQKVDLAKWDASKKQWISTETKGDEIFNYIHVPGDTVEGKVTTYVTVKDITEGNIRYTYYYEFIGWYVDDQLKYPALEEETYGYDIRLYAGYRVTKVLA